MPMGEPMGHWTVWAGSAWIRLQALQSVDGLSPLESRFERWHPALQAPVRTFEVIGFCCPATILIRHLPFNWLGIIGDSIANLPSYLLTG